MLRKYSAFFLCLFTIIALKSQRTNYWQQHVVYDMDIEVDVKNFTYTGKQKITYQNNAPTELQVIYFHLYWNAFQPNSMMDQKVQQMGKFADGRMIIKEPNGTITSRISKLQPNTIGYQKILSLSQNGKPLQYEIQETLMKVYLYEPIASQASTQIEMQWNAQLPDQIRRSGRNNHEGIAMSMTQWYPKVVEYDYEGWHTFDYIGREFHGVFGTFNVNITIDKEYVIGAGAVLQNPDEVKGYNPEATSYKKQKKVTWKWKADNIHDFAWAADPDYKVESFEVPITGPKVYYVYEKTDKIKLFWEQSKPKVSEFFQFMDAHFGKYLYPTYSFIQGGDGGMEYGMCSLILGESKTLDGLCGLMFHEAGHSWFQHMIATNESTRQWMDEGFTTYAEQMAMQNSFPELFKNVTHPMVNYTQELAAFQNKETEELACKWADHFEKSNTYAASAYVKGSVYLATLGYIIGEENLQKILLEYYNQWKLKHPTDWDFLHIAQEISEMDLKWYHNYMIYSCEKVDYAVKQVAQNAQKTTISIERKEKFPLPVDVYVQTKDDNWYVYNIPLNMMRDSKKLDSNRVFKTLPTWRWTQKEYSFDIDLQYSDIQLIVIDAEYRTPDVNLENNIWKAN